MCVCVFWESEDIHFSGLILGFKFRLRLGLIQGHVSLSVDLSFLPLYFPSVVQEKQFILKLEDNAALKGVTRTKTQIHLVFYIIILIFNNHSLF